MQRYLIHATAAAALLLASLAAAPAKANDDLFRIIAGVTAIAIIGSALSNDARARPHHSTRHDPHFNQRGARGHAAVPAQCVRTHYRHGRAVRVVDERCAQRFSRQAAASCMVTRWDRGQRVSYYDRRCLQRHGLTAHNSPR